MATYRSHSELRPRSLSGRSHDLEAENERLRTRLNELKEEAQRNDSLLRKTQERELDLLRAATLPQLFERLIHGLRASYQLVLVTVTLNDPQYELRHLVWGDTRIVSESQKSDRTNADGATWHVQVPANGTAEVDAVFDTRF